VCSVIFNRAYRIIPLHAQDPYPCDQIPFCSRAPLGAQSCCLVLPRPSAQCVGWAFTYHGGLPHTSPGNPSPVLMLALRRALLCRGDTRVDARPDGRAPEKFIIHMILSLSTRSAGYSPGGPAPAHHSPTSEGTLCTRSKASSVCYRLLSSVPFCVRLHDWRCLSRRVLSPFHASRSRHPMGQGGKAPPRRRHIPPTGLRARCAGPGTAPGRGRPAAAPHPRHHPTTLPHNYLLLTQLDSKQARCARGHPQRRANTRSGTPPPPRNHEEGRK